MTVRLAGLCSSLQAALDQAPRPQDFEPLSEQIYELARHAPRLVELLDDAPAAVVPLAASVGTLRESIQALENVQAGLADSLLRVPRAEDYDPLTNPLREFAQSAPRLLEGLRDVPALTRALAQTIATLGEIRPPREPGGVAEVAVGRGRRLEGIAERVESARLALGEALQTLPNGSDYAPLAAQLRELATVSPSLMDWLSEVPKVTEPLAASIEGLRATMDSLAAIRDDLRACVENGEVGTGPTTGAGPRPGARG